MKAIKYLFSAAFIVFLTVLASAQSTVNEGFSFGLNLNQYQRDFGIGLNVTSPSFAGDNLVVRATANLQYLQHVPVEKTAETWTGYGAFRLGLANTGAALADGIRLYGEGGAMLLLPNDEFSDKDAILGAYGLFGFEFYMHASSSFFLEAGGLGINAVADQLPNAPIYANGFLVSVGWRVHLAK